MNNLLKIKMNPFRQTACKILLLAAFIICRAQEGFEERAEQLISAIAEQSIDWTNHNSYKLCNFNSSALFAQGRDAEARSIVEKSLTFPLKEYKDPEFPDRKSTRLNSSHYS